MCGPRNVVVIQKFNMFNSMKRNEALVSISKNFLVEYVYLIAFNIYNKVSEK